MTREEIGSIVERQRAFFRTGATLPVERRLEALRKLQRAVEAREGEIAGALREDLGKSAAESYMSEIGMVRSELTYMLRHTASFARPKTRPTPLAQFAARSYERSDPYGVVLIMSPWNYPFLLTMDPLIDALAAGNTVVLKPSAYSPATSRAIGELVAECFPPELVAVVTGGRQENQSLLGEAFDYIFFTGSQSVGREVMRSAAAHLTPVTLELGGKSPCIVDKTAKISLAARRIVFGKFLNCGQTCVAPDYIYCHAAVKDALVEALKREIRRQYGEEPLKNGGYGKIINQKHFDRIRGLIDPEKVVLGGESDPAALRIAPTVMDGVTWEDRVMGEEIFGPVLPVLTYTDIGQVMEVLDRRDHPLALYLFTEDRAMVKEVASRCRYGGGCVNDTIIHLATSQMGFGGVGASGMGAYHGKIGFDTFSHKKSIVDKKTWMDLPMRYQPYQPFYEKMIRFFMK